MLISNHYGSIMLGWMAILPLGMRYSCTMSLFPSTHGLSSFWLVFMTQPALCGKGKDDVTGISLETVEVEKRLNGELYWKILELYNDQTRRSARQHRILLIELGDELPKTSRYFYDFFHFNNAGAA